MAQLIKQGDIFGRIGSGIGQGLSEQLPKEIERGRLAAGLKELGNQKGLTPFQGFAGLASLPGSTPQLLESGSRILNQQSYLDALRNQYEGQGGINEGQAGSKNGQGYRPTEEDLNQPRAGEIPTLATPEDTLESYKTFIPPTAMQERNNAYKNFSANPARYNYDFDKALAEQKDITTRNQEIQKAHQSQEATAVGKEETIKGALDNEAQRLGLKNIPAKSYQKFEEKILKSLLPKKDGGEGLTQEQAIKKYSKQLDQANRNYLDLDSLSSWSPADWNRRVDALQKQFASRGEEQVMMDQLIANGHSPLYAAHKAYPIKRSDFPTLGTFKRASMTGRINDITYEKLKNEMGKEYSPLSIGYTLQDKGQNPRGWIKYLDNHRDNLEGWQIDQLNKNINILDLKDMWLRAWE